MNDKSNKNENENIFLDYFENFFMNTTDDSFIEKRRKQY